MSTLAPLVMLSAVVPLGSLAPAWSLHEGDGPRRFAHTVRFERAFTAAPVVHLGVVGVDASRDHNLRLRTSAQDITPTGFTIVVQTWLQSQIWSVDVSWLAIGLE